ncbi:MAG: SET domain-containing protein [Ignavibacteriaceae bacterium]
MNLNYENFIIVKPSDIHGKGIFSTIDIPAGSEIMVIGGEIISEDECIRREEVGNVYIFWNEDNYLDASKTKKIKYINHKCDFNCEVLETENKGLKLAAFRDIAAGEELTIDYGYDEIYEACRCSLCA